MLPNISDQVSDDKLSSNHTQSRDFDNVNLAKDPIMDEQEIKLLDALNTFISIINDDDYTNYNEKSINSINKRQNFIANFIRIHLLSYLRFVQYNLNINYSRDLIYRDISLQWWITLLNYLNSRPPSFNLNNANHLIHYSGTPYFSIDLLSVILESISRLLTILLPTSIHSNHILAIYSNHIFLTINSLTNKLILTSKLLKNLSDFDSKNDSTLKNDLKSNKLKSKGIQTPKEALVIKYLNEFQTVLRSFIGKLNAFAFVYLPDIYNYDVLLLNGLFSKLQLNISYSTSPISTSTTDDNTNTNNNNNNNNNNNDIYLFGNWKKTVFTITSNKKNSIQKDNFENIKDFKPTLATLNSKQSSMIPSDIATFRILISYLKNDSIFLSFYWHYWYIVIKNLQDFSKIEILNKDSLKFITGSEIFLTFVTRNFLKSDFNKFQNFIKVGEGIDQVSILTSKSNTIPNNLNNGKKQSSMSSTNNSSNIVSNSQLNEFIFNNFKSIKLWECLRNLNDSFLIDVHNSTVTDSKITAHQNHNFKDLLILHDNYLLDHISNNYTALNSTIANLTYNKLFQFIIFQFQQNCKKPLRISNTELYSSSTELLASSTDSIDPTNSPLDFLDWNQWAKGLLSLIKTSNCDNQTIALLFLINNWDVIPKDYTIKIADELISNYWFDLSKDSHLEIVHILFIKLIVFRVVPQLNKALNDDDDDGDDNTNNKISGDNNTNICLQKQMLETIKTNINGIHSTIKIMVQELGYIPVIPIDENEDSLLFFKNRKLSIVTNNQALETDLIIRAERLNDLNILAPKVLNFPTVSSIANVRPSYLLKHGKYPYDVLDEMIFKMLLTSSQQAAFKSIIQKGYSTSQRSNNKSSNNSNESNQKVDSKPYNDTDSLSIRIGGWFSKLSTSVESPEKQTTSSRGNKASIDNPYPVYQSSIKNCIIEETMAEKISIDKLDTITISSVDNKPVPEISATTSTFLDSLYSFSSKSNNQTLKNSAADSNKRKVISPPELKYSSNIKNGKLLPVLFTTKILPMNSPIDKIEKANDHWGIITAKNYKKDLPTIPSDKSNGSVNNSENTLEKSILDSISSLEMTPEFSSNTKENETIIANDHYSMDKEPTLPKSNDFDKIVQARYSIIKPNMRIFSIKSSPDIPYSEIENKNINNELSINIQNNPSDNTINEMMGNSTISNEDKKKYLKIFNRNQHMLLETKCRKFIKALDIYNKTVDEYSRYLTFKDHENFFVDFEVRPSPGYDSLHIKL
ncbi:hypothetical protein TBLA_0I03070 [Henningerozyma blattae CBS 6284]|uniref:Uncharacterized protein n=1 Tax=Henningerozyma blattae (strain ATCC 34711 / CBS 6284 / DSM 70876 / NBRC 10599 / NRRL Y-10934 / UCD 77-7) TaxID=1071380 RepID=I2H9B0_HENB6|nr:hypothetical protein TBLA_0I03070 [Tetrapisispora blattae CBS 6284]CCH62962.1 hypothetical protein TBLA_0I03070 [Tetrapisispora blattae CBS 6284]